MIEKFCPYPGLRPFRFLDAKNFFGRDEIVHDIVLKLEKQGAVYLIGPSGSGKSSLAFAGVVPALHRGGFLSNARRWRVAVFRPSGGPIENLAASIFDSFYNLNSGKYSQGANTGNIELTATNVSKKRMDFIQLAKSGEQERFFEEVVRLFHSEELVDENGEPQENLLIIADQFEEIFRASHFYKHANQSDTDYLNDRRGKIEQFVELFLGLRDECDGRIFLFTTMRTDFLVDCEISSVLQRDIDRYDYSMRKLSAEECKEVILSPAIQNGVTIKTRTQELEDAEKLGKKAETFYNFINESFDGDQYPLIETLLREMDKETAEYLRAGGFKLPDQLPLLQHALCQIWLHRDADGDASDMGLRDYYSYIDENDDLIGSDDVQINETGLSQSLNNHLDDIYNSLGSADQKVTRQVFLSLVNIADGNRLSSRRRISVPQLLQEITLSGGMTQLESIIESFRTSAGRFLSTDKNLREVDSFDTVWIDISHESLLRHWNRLKLWINEESRDLALANDYFRRDKLYGADLREAILWRTRKKAADTFDKEWFNRHSASLSMKFSSESSSENFEIVNPVEVYKNIKDTISHSEFLRKRERSKKLRQLFQIPILLLCSVAILFFSLIRPHYKQEIEKSKNNNTENGHHRIANDVREAEKYKELWEDQNRKNLLISFSPNTPSEVSAANKAIKEKFDPEGLSARNVANLETNCTGFITVGGDDNPNVELMAGGAVSEIKKESKLQALKALKLRETAYVFSDQKPGNYILGKWRGTVLGNAKVRVIGDPKPFLAKLGGETNYWVEVEAPLRSCHSVYVQYSTDQEFYLASHIKRALRDKGFDVGPVEKVSAWDGYTKTKHHKGDDNTLTVSEELNEEINKIYKSISNQEELDQTLRNYFKIKIPNETIPETYDYSNNLEIWIGRFPEQKGDHFTPWYNMDAADKDGDFEAIHKIFKDEPSSYCPKPLSVECRPVNGTINKSLKNSCDIEYGYECKNIAAKDGDGGNICEDYEIKFECPAYLIED